LCAAFYNFSPERQEIFKGGGAAVGLVDLGEMYVKRRKYSDAAPLFRRAINIQKKALPPEHPDLLNAQAGYAKLLQLLNRKSEAQELIAHVRKMRAKQGGRKGKR
jgi:uncharacterized protein HemY